MRSGADPPRAVLDTNVLFSGLVFERQSPPHRIVQYARAQSFRLVLSPFILQELEDAFRKKTDLGLRQILALIRLVRSLATLVKPRVKIAVIRRKPADNQILECALEGHVDALVTGDKRDLLPLGSFQNIAILDPRAFLDRFFPGWESKRPAPSRVRERPSRPYRSRRRKK